MFHFTLNRFRNGLTLPERATPQETPVAGERALYFKTDGLLYSVDASGMERPILTPESQLHVNPSFDNVAESTGGIAGATVDPRLMPTDWSWYWGDPTGSLESDTSIVGDAGYSLKTTLVQAGVLRIRASTVTVIPGSLVTVSVDAKTDKVGADVQIALWTSDDTVLDPDLFNSTVHQSGWMKPPVDTQRFSASFLVPATHTRAAIVIVAGYGDTTGTTNIWLDNVRSSMTVQPPSSVVTGEMKMWPLATAPEGYLLCQGQILNIAEYPTLGTLLGSTHGGDGTTTFGLPDLRGRSPLGVGTATGAIGATAHTLAQKGGQETHTLTAAQSGVPAHTHPTNSPGWAASGANQTNISLGSGGGWYSDRPTGNSTAQNASQAHPNMHPYYGINFIIKT